MPSINIIKGKKTIMNYHVIYDGNCNLCVNLVKVLEKLDQGKIFDYIPMQDQETLQIFNITNKDCELGMILIDSQDHNKKWQGTEAAEEIAKMLPLGAILTETYRAIPGLKWLGDFTYEQVRDHRYLLFGKTAEIYKSNYGFCADGTCVNQEKS
jgi:predicted DCC family thiol-disulfide oxidoreductase YuxK